MRGHAWTAEQKDAVIKRWVAGASAGEIARELGKIGIKTTRNAVIGVIHRAGKMRGDRPSPPRKAVRTARAASTPDPKTLTALKPNGQRAGVANPRGRIRTTHSKPLPKACATAAPDAPLVIDGAPRTVLTIAPSGECRFPYGDPKTGEVTFCGRKVKPGKPYCPGHHAVAWRDETKRPRRKGPAPLLDTLAARRNFAGGA